MNSKSYCLSINEGQNHQLLNKLFLRLLFVAAVCAVLPQNQVFAADGIVDEVVTIGSRTVGRTAVDIAVPVDILSAETLKQTGQTEVGRMLQTVAPSFNFSSSSISDGTDALRPATLRGLGPDQTLVLINGKRRHNTSLVHVNTSVGRGSAGVDLNAIPAASIKRIEVLRDGAAAQYGSDALAGVINIVLNQDPDIGSLNVSYGQYSEDGETTNIDITNGFSFGDSGYVSGSINYRDRAATNRAGLSGQCQYLAGCDANNDGTGSSDPDGIDEAADPREAGFNRQNFRIGDADSEQLAVTLNTAYKLSEGEVYGFITYSDRDNQSGGFYRRANAPSDNPTLSDGEAFAPDGFLPLINSAIEDMSASIGYRTELNNQIRMDLSYTTGQNDFDFNISNSVNASYVNLQLLGNMLSDEEIRATTARSADAGKLSTGLQTLNLDFTKPMESLDLAWGVEFRRDEYQIRAGEEYSYLDYDTDAAGTNMFGAINGDAGIEVFRGFQPSNEVNEDRDVWSIYADAERQINDDFLLSAALRYDDYSDFGDTSNFKLAASYTLSETVKLRGATSTGFRAPSMQQQFFNNISTQFVVIDGMTVAQERGTFRNDSALARAIGIPELREEESVNYSLGVIIQPTDNLSIAIDGYKIDIDDRIVISGSLTSALGDPNLTAALASAGASGAQFFLNGADTETEGVDIVATYDVQLQEGQLNLSMAANFTETKVVNTFTSGGLQNISAEDVFTPQDISIIEDWQSEDRINLTANYSNEGFRAVLSFNRYGEYTVCEGSCDSVSNTQTFGAKVLTDLNLLYDLGNGLVVNLGGINIFDETPDTNTIGQTRAGTIADSSGNVFVDSNGVFDFSRRSAPFGFNGAYFFGGVSYSF
jgi:iron complex outermembrane receptor protein